MLFRSVIVLVIVLLVFGTKKLRNIGEDLGGAVKGFKDGMKGESEKNAQIPNQPHDGKTIDVNAKDVNKS